jgi:hypothetical protein
MTPIFTPAEPWAAYDPQPKSSCNPGGTEVAKSLSAKQLPLPVPS